MCQGDFSWIVDGRGPANGLRTVRAFGRSTKSPLKFDGTTVARAVRMNFIRASVCFVFLMSTTALAGADEPGPDKIILTDGSELRGTITQQDPGKFVVIRTVDGRTLTLNWADVRRVEAASPPAPAPAPAPVPAPAGPTTTTTQTSGSVDGKGPEGSFRQTTDCSKDPNQEICRRETTVDAGPGGLRAGFTQEKVTKVGTPPTTVVGFTIDGGFMYGTSTADDGPDVSIYGGGAWVGLRAQFGLTAFPDASGGPWQGITLHPTVGFFGAGLVYDVNGSTDGAGLTMLNAGVNAGYEYLSFGSMNPATLEQKGWGLFAGYRLGYAQTKVIQSQTVTSGDLSHGPVLGITFPKYNAGTSHVEKGYLNVLLLPTGDFLFFMLTGGYQF